MVAEDVDRIEVVNTEIQENRGDHDGVVVIIENTEDSVETENIEDTEHREGTENIEDPEKLRKDAKRLFRQKCMKYLKLIYPFILYGILLTLMILAIRAAYNRPPLNTTSNPPSSTP